MFDHLEVGMIAVFDTLSFPIIGCIVAISDTKVVVENGVRVLYDGRHGEFAKGAKFIPASAEIEKTYSPYGVMADCVLGCAEYPGGEIPKPQ